MVHQIGYILDLVFTEIQSTHAELCYDPIFGCDDAHNSLTSKLPITVPCKSLYFYC